MKLGVLAALDQRIGLRYAMPPMTAEETGSYLRHQVTLAGRSDWRASHIPDTGPNKVRSGMEV